MNTATATQRIQATCVLSLTLLVSGTTSAAHMHDHSDNELYRYESFATDTPDCVRSHAPRVIIFGQGFRQTAHTCNPGAGSATVASPPARLARPLSGNPYIRSGDSIRYSF
jgi:hypothetical protein